MKMMKTGGSGARKAVYIAPEMQLSLYGEELVRTSGVGSLAWSGGWSEQWDDTYENTNPIG